MRTHALCPDRATSTVTVRANGLGG
jgi:hypothetical protein